MFIDYASLFWVIIAILISGVFLGRAWWYLSTREENILKSRIVRGSSSYLLGMNYLISNQPDLAIMELSRAAKQDPGAVEVQVVLGNLFREKGQAEKAIQIHKEALERETISPSERNLAQFCLGLDYKSAGFVDRSIQVFEDLMEIDRGDERLLEALIKLYDETGQADKTYRLQRELIRLQRSEDYSKLALLEVQMGKKHLDEGNLDQAEKRFSKAIDMDPHVYPAYFHYGELAELRNDTGLAIQLWEKMAYSNNKRAHLIFRKLYRAYQRIGTPEKMESLLQEIMDQNKYDWRSRVFLARIKTEQGKVQEGYDLLSEAIQMNPHNLAIHLRLWKLYCSSDLDKQKISEYIDLTEEYIYYLDPFVCIECNYRSTEFLWKCPHCHSFESFVEMKM